MKRIAVALIMVMGFCTTLSAQEGGSSDSTPNWDPRLFIIENHLHQISGGMTILAATLTGAAGISLAAGVDWSALPAVHGALGYTSLTLGATTLALGLTAYSNRLDRVWPHALLMAVGETGMVLNAFVLERGSLPHRITGAVSVASLGLGLVSIILISQNEQKERGLLP